MATTQQIIDQLNAYDGDNIWQDVILGLDEYDEAATDALTSSRDRFALADGTIITYQNADRQPAGPTGVPGSHDAGWSIA